MPLTTAVSPGPPLGRGQGISFTKCPVPSPLTLAPHPPTPPPTMHTFSVEGPGLLSASVTFLSTSHPSSPDQSWQDISCSWVFLLKRDVGPTVSSDRTPFWSLRSLACMGVKSLLSCLTLCDPMDCSPPGSSVHGLSRQEYWRGLLCPCLGDLPNPGIEPSSLMSPVWAGGFLTSSATWEAP